MIIFNISAHNPESLFMRIQHEPLYIQNAICIRKLPENDDKNFRLAIASNKNFEIIKFNIRN